MTSVWVRFRGVAWGSRALALELSLGAIAVAVHLFGLANLPRGLHIDECSIGLNARLIATTGYDEHHVRFPLFFRAFGEYKNPIYVYAMAGLYRVFGYSIWTTRFTSFLMWALGAAVFYALGRRIWSDSAVRLYLLVCLSFTPWIFALSRVCFELIVLFPLIALYSFAIYRAFEERASWWWAGVAGASIGACVYAYSTFRLLALLQVVATLLWYCRRSTWRRCLLFASCAAVCVIPFALYIIDNPKHLTGRFSELTYLYDDKLSLLDKAQLFFDRYLGYFSLHFLATSGDWNRRHHSGYGGQLFVSTMLMAGVAVLAHVEQRARNRFFWLLVTGALLAPISGALTRDAHHSLRAFSLAFFAVLVSAYGVDWLRQNLKRFWTLVVLCGLLLSTTNYLRHYFSEFPSVSIGPFETYGMREALRRAASEVGPGGRVWVNDPLVHHHIVLQYYESLFRKRHPQMQAGERKDMRSGDVFVFRDPERKFPTLHEGLPDGSLYAVQRYDQLVVTAPPISQ